MPFYANACRKTKNKRECKCRCVNTNVVQPAPVDLGLDLNQPIAGFNQGNPAAPFPGNN